ncbi:MAG: metal-dependent hydrolase [Planctomycetota bacterium]|jgi:inner membrane protein
MDPISQCALGAVATQSASQENEIRIAALAGALSGLGADADVFIKSTEDPLIWVEYHRHFTHALPFVPVGALIAAVVLWVFLRKHISFGRLYLFTFIGYATGPLLDACTAYGTQLLWPFTNARFSWDLIAIVDPFFTIPLVIFAVLAVMRKRRRLARIGLSFAVLYLGLGLVQHERARSAALDLAQNRGHAVERMRVMPSIGNLILWRSVYESNGRYHVDALRKGIFAGSKIYEGTSIAKFELDAVLPGLSRDSTLFKDIQRFSHFCDGFVAIHPKNRAVLGDVRYGLLPDEIEPLWGITLAQPVDEHAEFEHYGKATPERWNRFMDMLLGRDPDEGDE